jgi:5-formaminoimidazole-4-carboxamide-1-beta-D-ribofuranosyl 5'-monophosphate synthetase
VLNDAAEDNAAADDAVKKINTDERAFRLQCIDVGSWNPTTYREALLEQIRRNGTRLLSRAEAISPKGVYGQKVERATVAAKVTNAYSTEMGSFKKKNEQD